MLTFTKRLVIPFIFLASFAFSQDCGITVWPTDFITPCPNMGVWADITVSGGNPPYSYYWFHSQETTEDVHLWGWGGNVFQVQITDAIGCTTNRTINVQQPIAPLTLTETHTDAVCVGGLQGAIDLSVTGGTGAYTYNWNNNQTIEDIQNLVAGTYTCVVTDNHLCYDSISVTILDPSNTLVLTTNHTDVSCFGGSNGFIDLAVSGGTPSYTYSWSNGQVGQDATGLTQGNYFVIVTDANTCQSFISVLVDQPDSALLATAVITDVACFGQLTGSIQVTTTGGTAPYSYSWSNGANTEDISNLSAGTYSVSVTDGMGCYYDYWNFPAITITQPTANISYSGPFCKSLTTAQPVTLTGTGSYIGGSYASTPSGLTLNPTTGVITPSTSTAGTYTVTYTVPASNGCPSYNVSTNVLIQNISTPTFTQVGPYQSGASIPALPTTSTNGITGTWSPAINNTATTTYTFTPTTGQCATTTAMTITVQSAASFDVTATNNTICAGQTTTLTVNLQQNLNVTDIDGNVYPTVQIGNQIWMRENLRVTRYENGDQITNITNTSQWGSSLSGSWTYYNNDSQFNIPYGKMYNWYAASDSRNVCPAGWHVPSDDDWTQLIYFLDSQAETTAIFTGVQSNIVGGKIKTTGTIQNGNGLWQDPNTQATNETLFSAVPGGYIHPNGGSYELGNYSYWWTSVPYNTTNAWSRYVNSSSSAIYKEANSREQGFSIRCVKN